MQDVFWTLWLVLGWIAIVIAFLIVLLRKYTFKAWSLENPNPYEKETLGLPRGLMRGILTLSLLFAVLILEVQSLGFQTEVTGDKIHFPEERFGQLMTAFQMMIAFYFGSKVVHHVTSAEERTKMSELAAQSGDAEFKDPDAVG